MNTRDLTVDEVAEAVAGAVRAALHATPSTGPSHLIEAHPDPEVGAAFDRHLAASEPAMETALRRALRPIVDATPFCDLHIWTAPRRFACYTRENLDVV